MVGYVNTRLSCLLLVIMLPFAALAQGFGEEAGMSSIPEGLLKFSLYGRDSVFVGYAAATSDSGAVGGGTIAMEQSAIIRGDVFVTNDLMYYNVNNTSRSYQTIAGVLAVGGNLLMTNGFQVHRDLYVQGNMKIEGHAGEPGVFSGKVRVGGAVNIGTGNQFKEGLYITQDSILVTSNDKDNYFGTPPVALQASILRSGVHNAPQLHWNTPFSVPEHLKPVDYEVPTTTVIPSENHITVSQNVWWNSTMVTNPVGAVSLASNGEQVLPPGSYGNLHLKHDSKIMLGEGIYHFANITMDGTNHLMRVYQPTGGRTQILVDGSVKFEYKSSLMPLDTANNKGGTVLLYANNALTIGQENSIWSTLIAPNDTIKMVYGSNLFGQAFAQYVFVDQYFEGNDGRYIPFYPAKPKIGLVFSQGDLVPEGSGGGTKIFLLTFAMDHENGLPVTVYFHTQFRTPAQPGNADANDINLIAKDSVVFPVGVTQVDFKKLLIKQDNDFELDDYFDLILDSVVNGVLDSIPANNKYALGIKNDDAPPVMNFADPKVLTVSENAGALTLGVKLSAKSILPSTANISVQSKVGIVTYQVPASITVAAGDTTASFVFTINEDLIDAPDDTLRVILRTADALKMTVGADSVKTIIVKDNDDAVKLAASMQTAFTVNEPSTGKTTVKIPVVLAGVSGWDIPWAIKVASGNGDALAQVDQDFRIVKGNGKIAAGKTSDTIVVEVLSDIWDEGDESFTLVFDATAGKTDHLDYSGKDSIQVTIPKNGGPVLQDVTIELDEGAPVGADVATLNNVISSRRDTVIAYTWTLEPGLDASAFAIAKEPGKGWVLEVKDNSGMNYTPGMDPLKAKVKLCSKFNCATSTITVNIVNTKKNPQIERIDTIKVVENSPGGTVVDSIQAKDGSGWDLVWKIIGGSGSESYAIDSVTGIVTVRPGVDLDYEDPANRTQKIQVQVTNAHDKSDTIWVVVQLKDELEYSFVKIEVAQIPEGKRFVNPDTIWINSDSLDLEWKHDRGDTSETIGFSKDGTTQVIRTYCDVSKNFCGSDTLVVLRNTKVPTVSWNDDKDEEELPRHTVQMPRDSGDTKIYTNDPKKITDGKLTYIDSTGREVTVDVKVNPILKEGKDVEVIYTYTDPYGNTVSDTLVYHLDTQAPVVKIFNPLTGDKFWIYNINVGWTVDGAIMDTLNRASLDKGKNMIRRYYMDLAGNIGADSVEVELNINKSDVDIDIVNPMVTIDPADVENLNKKYPPRKDESFTFTGVNQETLEEEEMQWGKPGQVVVPKDEERRTYNGLVNHHIGPTLRIETRFQHVGGLNGEGQPRGGTLADLFEKMRADGIDESSALCGEAMPSDPYKVPLWRNDIRVVVEYFDNLGQYVDRFVVEQSDITHEFLNDGGVGVFYFTIEPDKMDMRLKTTTGRAIANGPYVLKSSVTAKSTYLWCAGGHRKGEVLKSTESSVKLFGYRRAIP